MFSTTENEVPDDVEEAASVYHLQDMMLGVWRGQVIKAAIDFDIFTQLYGKKLTSAELAEACKMHTVRKPEEFFNVLVSVKLLEKND